MLRERLAAIFEISHGQHKALLPMEGLRGFAVILVFLVHYSNDLLPWVRESAIAMPVMILRDLGNIGVDLFFVLSGFLIYGSLMRREQAFLPYLRRRIQRIYPAFLAVFALYLVLHFIDPMAVFLPKDPWRAVVYLVQNLLLLPGLFPITPMNMVTWSLSFEFFFYLVVPVLIAVLRLRQWSPPGRLVLFFVIAAMIFWLVPRYAQGPWQNERMMMFVAGMIIYELKDVQRVGLVNALAVLAVPAALAITVVLILAEADYAWRVLGLFVCFGYLCYACLRSSGTAGRLFSWTPLRWLGNMSYSYYLIHAFVVHASIYVFRWVLPPTGDQAWLFWVLMPFVFAATLAVSAALFVVVEKPWSLTPRSPAARAVRA